jgi:hypothetical protein
MTQKEQKVFEAMKSVREAEVALFNALFDNREIEQAVEASNRANAMFTTFMKYRHSRKVEAA